MFGLSNLQIYRIQGESNGMKVTANILEKFIKNEVIASAALTTTGQIKNGYNINDINTNINNNNIINKKIDINERKNGFDKNCNQKLIEKNSSIGNIEKNLNKENSNDVIIDDKTKSNLAGKLNSTIKTSENFNMQRKKYMQVIQFLNKNNQHLEEELSKEKRRRAEELSKIIKSLLCFEAKLKHDKKVINQKLYEKDTEICRLINLNKMLRQKYGDTITTDDDDDDDTILNDDYYQENGYHIEAQYCPNCRKDFYGIDGKDVCTQTFYDGHHLQSDNTEHGSSSDETLSSSFYGARRSIRYTSKRTFGTFRDYMRSRCMNIDDPNYDNSEENGSILSREDSQSSYGQMNGGFSKKIDRLHGIKNRETDDIGELYSDNENRKIINSTEIDDDTFHEDDVFLPDNHNNNNNNNNNNCRIKEFAEISQKHDFETTTDDWYASSDVDDGDSVAKPYYGYNAVNPVLECVNQILLQQSMEESLHDGPASLESNGNNSGSSGGTSSNHKDTTISRKRVHFSTKNSMVHVPRDDSTSPTPIIDTSNHHNSSNYESIYSNEYEPIGSEQNSSNHYVDMESKLGQEDQHIVLPEKSKHPPALPPKPANLMKFKRVLRIIPQSIKEVEQKIEDPSEPDYCSISEINEPIKNVQIIADVHKSADDNDDNDDDIISIQSDSQSQKTDDVEEIFADVPKLPNVQAIIAPKVNNKFINHDNYITKSPNKDDNGPTTKSQHVPNILAEINRKTHTTSTSSSVPTTPTKCVLSPISPNKIQPNSCTTTPVKVLPDDKLPLQAEFDWYNLDVEYGKSNQPDVIKETDPINVNYENHDEVMSIIDEDNDRTHGVEYNLDEEFSLVNQPDIIKENVLEPKTTVCDGFPTIVDQTPCNQKIKIKKNFTNFIDGSGLSTKPLPRQRKIYFSGPFV